MSERWWSVHVDADVGSAPDETLEDLLAILPDAGGSSPALSSGDGELSLWFSVQAPGAGQAVTMGLRAFAVATGKLGIDVNEIFRAEAVTHDRLDQELEEDAERYVGVSEIAAMIDVSKQRVSELRTRPDFPAPVAELAAGPVWRESSMRRFIAEWPRRAGRPGTMLQAIEDLRARGELAAADVELTDAQRRVLAWMAEGATTKEIAKELGLTDEAVRSHIRRLLAKLSLHSKLVTLEGLQGVPLEPVPFDEESSETPARSR